MYGHGVVLLHQVKAACAITSAVNTQGPVYAYRPLQAETSSVSLLEKGAGSSTLPRRSLSLRPFSNMKLRSRKPLAYSILPKVTAGQGPFGLHNHGRKAHTTKRAFTLPNLGAEGFAPQQEALGQHFSSKLGARSPLPVPAPRGAHPEQMLHTSSSPSRMLYPILSTPTPHAGMRNNSLTVTRRLCQASFHLQEPARGLQSSSHTAQGLPREPPQLSSPNSAVPRARQR